MSVAGTSDLSDGQRRSRGRSKPPTSLVEYAVSRDYCSVTDLVSPVWCEYAFQYNLLGLSHLPVSERPKEITTPQGKIVKVNVEKAQQRDKILTAGKQVHKRLEQEIHPVKVYIQTTTREDTWGLKLLQLISGLKTLMSAGCCRELPVFGLIQGTLVFGVIDEIKLHYDNRQDSPKRKWSSQEDWKKRPIKQKKSTSDSSQKTLAAFLPGGKVVTKDTTIEEEDIRTFGFVLEDAKTRLAMSMPEEKDQVQSKLQCMIYKRLLEGLIAGLSTPLEGAIIDEFATVINADVICNLLDLDGECALSESFMADAQELCIGYNLNLMVMELEEERWSCNLNHLFRILSDIIDDLVKMAKKGAIDKGSYSVIQNELRLTYRQRGRWSPKKSASNRSKRQSQPSMGHRLRDRKINEERSGDKDILKMLQPESSMEELDEEAQVELALQISLDDTNKEEEEEKLADHTIVMPSSPTKERPKDSIIGTVRFQHDTHQLQEHLVDMMEMWRGKRPLRGVTVEQTWRCNHCEYQADCEWRQLKAEESLQQAINKRQKSEDEVMWSQVEEFPDDLEW